MTARRPRRSAGFQLMEAATDHQGAVRDACDLGYLVTLVSDACTTESAERHEQSLLGIRGYCRQRRTEEFVAEITALTG